MKQRGGALIIGTFSFNETSFYESDQCPKDYKTSTYESFLLDRRGVRQGQAWELEGQQQAAALLMHPQMC